MPALLLTGAVVKTGTDQVQLAEKSPVNDGVLSFPGSRRAAVRAGLEFSEVFLDLLSDHGLLHAMQQHFGFRECQAEFLRTQRTTLQPHNFLDLLRFTILSFYDQLYSHFHRRLLSIATSRPHRGPR